MKSELTIQEWMKCVEGLELDKEVEEDWFGIKRRQ